MPNSSLPPTDVELIQSLRAGEQMPLRLLYDRYSGLVYTVALRILERSEEAEDLTQEVFLTFWKDAKFDPARAALSTYLSLLSAIARTAPLRPTGQSSPLPQPPATNRVEGIQSPNAPGISGPRRTAPPRARCLESTI